MLAASILRAIMEAASNCEMSVSYQTTRHNNPEYSHFMFLEVVPYSTSIMKQ
jgi:hypothetical protein